MRTPNPTIRHLIDGKAQEYSSTEFFARTGVTSAVRILESEFNSIDPATTFIAHFNLEETTHEVGKKYLFLKILEHGFCDESTGEEQTPLLSLDGAFAAECVKAENHIPYGALGDEYFQCSFGGITDVESLKEAIVRRYAPSRKHLSREEILSRGVGYTLFKIVLPPGVEPGSTR